MHVMETRMLRWMCGHTRVYKIRNEVIPEGGSGLRGGQAKGARLRWLGHVKRRSTARPKGGGAGVGCRGMLG
ncbi:hypothetical protein H5410_012526 [Solanum commersonii]|uniref:Uncharacterized protein n=1 Tax=Solanum commersonii TaxID=4109 RepID=A0A9J6ASF0_SOLCO|nr:hypothetical protein H5410_012526 [Solanum commersonii]